MWIWVVIEYEYGYPPQAGNFRLAQNSVILVEGVWFTILPCHIVGSQMEFSSENRQL